MIRSFRCRVTEAMFNGKRLACFAHIAAIVADRLAKLDGARSVDELGAADLHRRDGGSAGGAKCFALGLDRRWWLAFEWRDGHAWEVEIAERPVNAGADADAG